MPGEVRKVKPGSSVRDIEDTFPLVSLPAPVLARIAELSLRSVDERVSHEGYGHPLLRVSQACRDAVLHATKTISLPKGHSQATAADARLLHRACCEASPGLEVSLSMTFRDPVTLCVLLQPGIISGGWTKVHTLGVRLRRASLVLPLKQCELSMTVYMLNAPSSLTLVWVCDVVHAGHRRAGMCGSHSARIPIPPQSVPP
jgi:hypothetical protein